MKISVIITAWKEERTIGKAVGAFLNSLKNAQIIDFELIVVSPDIETRAAAKTAYGGILGLRDDNKGKPEALNLAFKQARGDILILSDGEVFISPDAIANLLKYFDDKKVGMVSGRPVPTNARDHLMGYWAHLLTTVGAHAERTEKAREQKFFEVSGYLFAMRNFHWQIPGSALSEDAAMSHLIWNRGFKIAYAPDAIVNVKMPDNLRDWLKQKRRSTGGHNQINEFYRRGILDQKHRPAHPRTFWREISYFFRPFAFAQNFREFLWTILLYPARLWLWTLIFWDINLGQRKKLKRGLWERIESTK